MIGRSEDREAEPEAKKISRGEEQKAGIHQTPQNGGVWRELRISIQVKASLPGIRSAWFCTSEHSSDAG